MGYILSTECSSCNKDGEIEKDDIITSLYVGNGMADSRIISELTAEEEKKNLSRTPYYCTSCEIIFTNSIGKDPVLCPKCERGDHVHSYYSKEACEPTPSQGKRRRRKKRQNLTKGNYYCPRCKTYSLTFTITGLWD